MHSRRGFASYFLGLLPLGWVLAAENPKGETLRGKLVVRAGEPTVVETDHGPVAVDSDEPNRKVLHDERLNGFELQARGHLTGQGQFLIDPQHTRSMLVRDRDGRYKMVTYWCDVCSIRTYIPGPCMCCQKYTDLDLRDPDNIQ